MLVALLSCAPPDEPSAEVLVTDGWTRQIAPGQSAAAVYLTIANSGAGRDRLVDVQAAAGDASLHATSSSNGVARMRPLANGIEIAGRSTVELKPGGTHIMVTDLEQRPAPGETIQLMLSFERSGDRPVAVRVVGAGVDAHSSHGMAM
jgi:hypothetical protein